MKIAMYKNQDGDLSIQPIHKMKEAKGYIRISEVEDVKFKESRHLLHIKVAATERRIDRDFARLSELKTMLIEGYGDDK